MCCVCLCVFTQARLGRSHVFHTRASVTPVHILPDLFLTASNAERIVAFRRKSVLFPHDPKWAGKLPCSFFFRFPLSREPRRNCRTVVIVVSTVVIVVSREVVMIVVVLSRRHAEGARARQGIPCTEHKFTAADYSSHAERLYCFLHPLRCGMLNTAGSQYREP